MKRVTFRDQLQAEVTVVPKQSKLANFGNFLIMVAVAVPALWIGYLACMQPAGRPAAGAPLQWPTMQQLLDVHWWLALALDHPFVFVNAVSCDTLEAALRALLGRALGDHVYSCVIDQVSRVAWA